MQKASLLLIVTGGILGLGIILSFYGNHILFDNLTGNEGSIEAGEELVVETKLNRTDMNGIYAIQIIEGDDDIQVHVLDPYNMQIKSEYVDEELFEGTFVIDTDGVYKLVVKNDGSSQSKIFAVMGPEPDVGAKSLGFISLYILTIGLLGMAGVGIFAIKNRKSS